MERELDLEAIPPPEAVSSPRGFAAEYADFEQVEQLGSGGNAAVYRAYGPDGQEIALKVPHIEGTLSATVLDEFTTEAETWAGLDDHDHVVGIMDWGQQPVPWLAMEYMDGGSLRDRVGEVELTEALWIVAVVTRTLRHAHRHGVVHLDIKPENVLFREMPEGQWDVPKVADWGLAQKLLDFEGEQTGLSLQYAAPEQLGSGGATPDNRTDVYQLGAVTYELLTGRPPFEGDEVHIVEEIRTTDPVPPSELDPSLPTELDEVLLSALAKDQDDRYEDILLFRDAVEELLEVQLGERDTTSDLGSATRDSRIGEDSAQQGARSKGPDEKFCRSCGAIVDEAVETCPECGSHAGGHVAQTGAAARAGSQGAGTEPGASTPPATSTTSAAAGGLTADLDVYRDADGTASLEEALAYPRDTDQVGRNVIVGGLLGMLSFLVLPAVVLTGYYVTVVRTSIDDRRHPPAFDDWGTLATEGVYGSVVTLAYVGVAILGMMVAGVVGSDALSWLMLLLLGLTTYTAGIALGAYAATGELTEAFDVDLLLEVATHETYLRATAKLAAVLAAGGVAFTILVATGIGTFAVPFLWVFVMTAAGRIHGTGYAETVAELTAGHSTREPPREQAGGTAGRDADDREVERRAGRRPASR